MSLYKCVTLGSGLGHLDLTGAHSTHATSSRLRSRSLYGVRPRASRMCWCGGNPDTMDQIHAYLTLRSP